MCGEYYTEKKMGDRECKYRIEKGQYGSTFMKCGGADVRMEWIGSQGTEEGHINEMKCEERQRQGLS